jgi:hypothetical protein
MKRIFYWLTLVLVLLGLPAALYAQSGTGDGSFAFTLNGYTVQGKLLNAIIRPDNSVRLDMNVLDTIRTTVMDVPISGSGEWYGTVNVTALSGTINDVHGSAQVCIFFIFCSNADYIGQGTWTGTLSGSQGTGTFQGTITFTSSPVPQILVNQPIPVSGTWNSNFQISS